jgi:hypothetical protein
VVAATDSQLPQVETGEHERVGAEAEHEQEKSRNREPGDLAIDRQKRREHGARLEGDGEHEGDADGRGRPMPEHPGQEREPEAESEGEEQVAGPPLAEQGEAVAEDGGAGDGGKYAGCTRLLEPESSLAQSAPD